MGQQHYQAQYDAAVIRGNVETKIVDGLLRVGPYGSLLQNMSQAYAVARHAIRLNFWYAATLQRLYAEGRIQVYERLDERLIRCKVVRGDEFAELVPDYPGLSLTDFDG